MAKRAKQVTECLQCSGDEMLGVREDASQLHDIMAFIAERLWPQGKRHKDGTPVIEYVRRLATMRDDCLRLQRANRENAQRRLDRVNELIAALRFVSDASKNNSSGVSVGGRSLTVDVSQLLATAIERLKLISAADNGLLEGRQPSNEVDHLADLWINAKTTG